MKIRITESQYSKIRLINEEVDYLEKYKSFCADSAKQVDIIYSRVINESIGELLNMSIDAEVVTNKLGNIENQIYAAEKNMINMWEKSLIGSNDDSFDVLIGDIASFVTDKITSLTLILTNIEKMQEFQKEHNLTKSFKNISSIEVQGTDT